MPDIIDITIPDVNYASVKVAFGVPDDALLHTGKLLREGVTLGVAEDEGGGLRVQLTDEGVVLDLSDKAIAEVLLQHLQPRFRALLEGIVK